MPQLTHLDSAGQVHMVGVDDKVVTHRVAVAVGTVCMLPETFALVCGGSARKGNVPGIVYVTVIQGSKRTSDLIPLCHPLALTKVAVEFSLGEASHAVRCTARAETRRQTGVEMEALTAVQVGLLTVYDMCKTVDRGMAIGDMRLLEKHGGKSGD